MMNVYFIGGSPCSGKSTVMELIANKFNLHYFKVDELLSDYIEIARDKGKVFSTKQCQMTVNENWLRDPVVQCKEALAIYREILEFIFKDLSKIHAPNRIIAEGAAYLPELMKQIGVDSLRPKKMHNFRYNVLCFLSWKVMVILMNTCVKVRTGDYLYFVGVLA